jgi:hypothetical protein
VLSASKINYVLNYFRAIYSIPDEIEIGYGNSDKKVNIYCTDSPYFSELSVFPIYQIVWKDWGGREIPILFPGKHFAPLLEEANGKVWVNDDLLASIFFFLSGWQEYIYMKTFAAIRYDFRHSLQYHLDMAAVPVVNYYLDVLKSAVEAAYNIELPSPMKRQNYDLCLTHDIDLLKTGWRENLYFLLKHHHWQEVMKLIAQKICGHDTNFNLHEIMALEKKYGARSTFFFLTTNQKVYVGPEVMGKGNLKLRTSSQLLPKILFRSNQQGAYQVSLPNADYCITDGKIVQLIADVQNAGFEVGFHGGFGSSVSAEVFRQQLEKLPVAVRGGRFHYLCFDALQTIEVLEQNKITYDTTLGFAETVGFRNGICYPFLLYNIPKDRPSTVMEIPLTVMDTTLCKYLKLKPEEVPLAVETIWKEVKKFDGCLTLLWHNDYFTPYKYRGWATPYEAMLQRAKQDNAGLKSADQIEDDWRSLLAAVQ